MRTILLKASMVATDKLSGIPSSLRKKLRSASFFSGLRPLRLLTARQESVFFAQARPCFSRHFGPGPRM
jgi:hypothetical protein